MNVCVSVSERMRCSHSPPSHSYHNNSSGISIYNNTDVSMKSGIQINNNYKMCILNEPIRWGEKLATGTFAAIIK